MFEDYLLSDGSLAVSRVLTALYLLAMAYPRYVWLAGFPSSFYAPPLGLGVFFRRLPPSWLLWLLLVAAISLTLALLVGWHTRASGLALVGVTLVGNTFEYALGKINHDILALMIVLTMSFSGWGRRYSVDARRGAIGSSPTGWPLAMLALLVGFAMFSAGLPKALSGWLDPRTHSAQAHLLNNYYVFERPTLAGRLALDYAPAFAWEALDWATVVLELAFLPAALSRRAMLAVGGLAAFFHAGIHFTMGISFHLNVLAYGMFVDWEGMLKRGAPGEALDSLAALARVPAWSVLPAGVALTAFYGLVGNPLVLLLSPLGDGDWLRHSLAILAPCALVAIVAGHAVLRTVGGTTRRLLGWVSGSPLNPHPLILFDGVCGMCNRAVDWVLARDRAARFRFAPLQSVGGQAALTRYHLPVDYTDSIVLIAGDRCYRYSSASLEIMRRLGPPWAFLWPLVLIPPPVRDLVYDFIAARRYRWFGKLEACRLPTPEERARFID
jgi:predicted DCC family thiol-disulfide oxidoreductase YuxK